MSVKIFGKKIVILFAAARFLLLAAFPAVRKLKGERESADVQGEVCEMPP